MKKDKLEEFINENRAEFDEFSPDSKIWNKINPNNQLKGSKSRKLVATIYRIAAGLLIFAASYAFHEFIDIREKSAENNKIDGIYKQLPELKEAEYYYNNLVNLRMDELQPFFAKIPGLENEIHIDISELDSIYSSLKEDLKDNIANDQVIEAMIQNYRLKIKILEDMLSDVSYENKTTENENYI